MKSFFPFNLSLLFKNLWFRVPRGRSDKEYIFIIGAPRSGTTLLKSMMAAHPRIGGSDYESTGVFGLRDIFAYALGELTPDQVHELLHASRDIIQFYDALTDRLLQRSDKVVFVDKLQMRGYRLRYVSRQFPNAKFISIVRDGRDCYCSALHHPNIPQSSSLESFAAYWRKCVAMPTRVLPKDRLHVLHYEDLTSAPEDALRSTMEFLGLEFDGDQLLVERYAATTSIKKREVHQNLAKPITTARHGRWRSELAPEANDAFKRIAAKELRLFGYEID